MSIRFLSESVAGLYLSDVHVVITPIDDHSHELLAEEKSLLTATMADKRIRSLSTGRVAARRALANFDIVDYPLLAGESRAPLWPDGIVGSLSHAGDQCVAVVSRRSDCAGLGIDIERAVDLQPRVRQLVLTEDERRQLDAMPSFPFVDSLLFSIKESVYKCYQPHTQTWLGFQQANVTLDIENSRYSVVLTDAEDLGSFSISGGFLQVPGLVCSSAELLPT